MVLEESWSLAKACFQVLRKDKEMIIYPLILTAIVFAIMFAFIIGILYDLRLFIGLIISIPVLVVALSFLGNFFEAAVIRCASIRLDGGNPRIRDGFNIAADRLWQLFKWTLISIAVGLIMGVIRGAFRRTSVRSHSPRSPSIPRFPPLKLITLWSGRDLVSNRLYSPQNVAWSDWGIGDIIAGVLGMAWSVATFFVIPTIIYEGLPPLRAIRRSWEIVKRIWKETLILKLGFGALFGLLSLIGLIPLIAGFWLGIKVLPEPVKFEWMNITGTTNVIMVNPAAVVAGISTSILYWILLSCVSFTMKGILRAVLYKYSLGVYVRGEKVCAVCGLKVAESDAQFCPECGAKLEIRLIEIPRREDEFSHLNKFLEAYV